MPYIRFGLQGDIALWRNYFEPVSSMSSLGPAPSQIAGLIGAAMGFASPRSVAGSEGENDLKQAGKKGLLWPVSSELLKWQVEEDYVAACRWCGGPPHRSQWNVNGIKGLKGGDTAQNLRLIQTVIEDPHYEVLVGVKRKETASDLAMALRNPVFPLYLGTSFCRAIVTDITTIDSPEAGDRGSPWAYWSKNLTFGEAVPFSRHVVNDRETGERIQSEGYWIYPTPLHEPPKDSAEKDPCEQGYVELS